MPANEYKIDDVTFVLTGTVELLNIHNDGNQTPRSVGFGHLGGRYSVNIDSDIRVGSTGLGEVKDAITTISYGRLGATTEHARWEYRFQHQPDESPDPPNDPAPSSLTCSIQTTFTLERWFHEGYGEVIGTDPDVSSVEDIRGRYLWKYKAGASVSTVLTLNGDTVSFSDDPDTDAALLNGSGSFDGLQATFTSRNYDPSAGELAGTAYAALSGADFSVNDLAGVYDNWSVTQTIFSSTTEDYGPDTTQDQERSGMNGSSVPLPVFGISDPDAIAQVTTVAMQRTNRFRISGELHEGENAVSPFTFRGLTFPGTTRLNEFGNPNGGFTLPTEYDNQRNGGSALWEYGDRYDNFSIDHAPSIVIDTWEYRWNGSDLGGSPSIDGDGKLHLTGGTTGTPTYAKTLVSDLEALIVLDIPGRAAWWQDRKAEGLISTALDDWWNATGDPANTGTDHEGEWYKIRRRIRGAADSDEFNWNCRYLNLRGSADEGCEVTVRVEWDQLRFKNGLPPLSWPPGEFRNNAYWKTVLRTPRDESWTVTLGTEEADHLIDLSAKSGPFPMNSVKTVTLTFPNDRQLVLAPLELKRKASPKLYAHPLWPSQSYEQASLFADLDGMASLALHDTKDDGVDYLSTSRGLGPWTQGGWPVVRLKGEHSPSFDTPQPDFGYTEVPFLVEEIGLQLGWSAEHLGGPGHSSPDLPFWWDYFYAQPTPLTLTARRKFCAGIGLPSGYLTDELFEFQGHIGSYAKPLVVDAATKLPVRAKLALERETHELSGLGTPVGESAGFSLGNGSGRLYAKQGGERYEIYASKGEAEESSAQRDRAPLLSVWFSYLTGKDEGILYPSIDTDFIKNLYLGVTDDAEGVKLGRLLGTEGAMRYNGVDPNTSLLHPSVTVCNSQRGKIVLVSADDGENSYLFAQDPALSTSFLLAHTMPGTFPTLEYDDLLGQLMIVVWEGGNAVLRKTRDLGATFVDSARTIASGIPEQPVQVKRVNEKLVSAYSDEAGDWHLRKSLNAGRDWADAP